MNILFVCIGNICRSPCAHAILQTLQPTWTIESAGTHAHNYSSDMDQRMKEQLSSQGIHFSHKPRQVSEADIKKATHVFVMEEDNYYSLKMSYDEKYHHKIHFLREFDPINPGKIDVSDPYYGGKKGFEDCYHIIERSCTQLATVLNDTIDEDS